MMARYWRSMFTDFWMLAAERVPVRNVWRPRARGFCTSSSSRTEPAGLSSARSMRTPLDPMSMTEMTGVAPAAPTGTAPAIAGVVVVVSGMGLQHRFQGELLLEEIATLFSDGPLVQGDVPPRARLERELGILGLGRDPEHVLAVIVIQRVRQPQDCRQSAHLIAGALRERRVVLVAAFGVCEVSSSFLPSAPATLARSRSTPSTSPTKGTMIWRTPARFVICSKITPAGTITSARSGRKSYFLARCSGSMPASSSTSFFRRPSGTAT